MASIVHVSLVRIRVPILLDSPVHSAGAFAASVSNIATSPSRFVLLMKSLTTDVRRHCGGMFLNELHDSHVGLDGGSQHEFDVWHRWMIWKDSRLVHALLFLLALGQWTLFVVGTCAHFLQP